MPIYLAYNRVMKIANIAEFKDRLSHFLSLVEQGEEIEVRKRNVPVARVSPIQRPGKNRTKPGCGRGTVQITGDLTEPLIPEQDWQMLHPDQE